MSWNFYFREQNCRGTFSPGKQRSATSSVSSRAQKTWALRSTWRMLWSQLKRICLCLNVTALGRARHCCKSCSCVVYTVRLQFLVSLPAEMPRWVFGSILAGFSILAFHSLRLTVDGGKSPFYWEQKFRDTFAPGSKSSMTLLLQETKVQVIFAPRSKSSICGSGSISSNSSVSID